MHFRRFIAAVALALFVAGVGSVIYAHPPGEYWMINHWGSVMCLNHNAAFSHFYRHGDTVLGMGFDAGCVD